MAELRSVQGRCYCAKVHSRCSNGHLEVLVWDDVNAKGVRMTFEAEIKQSVDYLSSDLALQTVDADAYWPKRNASPSR